MAVMLMPLCLMHLTIFGWLVSGDQEHLQHGGHVHTKHDVNGQHNVEFDHEAILGSQDVNDEFSKLSASEAKKKLAVLLSKMDVNGDSYISSNEISDWVLNNFRKQDEVEVKQKLLEVDLNGDGRVSWSEYSTKVFGYSEAELQRFAEDPDPGLQTFNKMVGDEVSKFKLADSNHDGSLELEEYAAFLHPQNYDFMHSHEIDRTLTDYDKNGDGVVSFEEYLGESKPDREQLIVDRENFNTYDTNSDGRLDRTELRSWVLPDRRSVADEEAEHLVSETDMNHDGKLTFDEILDRHDLWVGSAATDYGQELKHDAGEL
jgi:Ca2+-binding EF-hand superfamily protein